MRIIKALDKKVGDTTYYKYKINLPKKIVEEGKFLDNNLGVTLEDNKIIIKKL